MGKIDKYGGKMMNTEGLKPVDEKMGISSDIKIPLARKALRRSSVRLKIAGYLFDISPSYSYTSEIAYHTKTTPTNVLGAIRGMVSRYREAESLICLGIVEMTNGGKNVKLYRITPFGKEVVDSLNYNRNGR